MININLTCQSNHWPARLKKVDLLINKIITFHKDLSFSKNIIYNCNIILTDNKLITKMNSQFRKKKKSTDVLTFVSEINFKKKEKHKICDIFLSAEMINKDAKKNKITFYDHLAHLIIHSFLHINGFMHYKIKDFKKMKDMEIKILKKIGIENPYLLH